MNRIFKRPMFRKGGTPNEGIMDGLREPRKKYVDGGDTGIGTLFPEDIFTETAPPRKYVMGPLKDLSYGDIASIFTGGTIPTTTGMERSPELPSVKLPQPETIPEVKPEQKPEQKIRTQPTAKSDAETIKEYMDMFKTALAGDEDEITRQKYLQLAQFGANILAQPGGDLVGAIGKAAAPSIAELGKIQAREKAAEREAQVLGLQAALKRLDPTKLEETVRYLQREMPGISTEKAINMAIAGSTGKAQTQESRIQANAEALTGEIGQAPALKAARAMEIIGRNYAEFSLLPVDKEGKIKPDTPDGLYYDKKGNLSIIDKGVKSDIKIGSK